MCGQVFVWLVKRRKRNDDKKQKWQQSDLKGPQNVSDPYLVSSSLVMLQPHMQCGGVQMQAPSFVERASEQAILRLNGHAAIRMSWQDGNDDLFRLFVVSNCNVIRSSVCLHHQGQLVRR